MQSSTMRPSLYWLAFIAFLWLQASHAAASDMSSSAASLVKALASWEDRSAQGGLPEAMAAGDWQGFSGWKSFGFGAGPIWVRLHLKAAETADGAPWVVLVRPPFLDKLTLYDPATKLVQQLGNANSLADDALRSINYAFQIPALPYERDIYLKVETTSSRTMEVDVLPYRQAQQNSHQQEWLFGFVSSLSLILALWAVVQWWQTREDVIGAFAIKQIVSAAWAFLYLGFARIMIGPWLPLDALSTMIALAFPLLITSTFWFMSRMFKNYQPSVWWLRICVSLAIFSAFLPLMLLPGLAREMRVITNIVILIAVPVMLTTLLTARRSKVRQPIPYKYLLAYYVAYCMLNSAPPTILPGFG
jgi:hypothetical protein